jgi:peptide chain release factor 2
VIHFDLASKKAKIAKMEEETMSPDFWSDSDKAQLVMRDLRILRDTVNKFENIQEDFEHLEIAYELEYEKEVKKYLKTLQVKIDAMEIETMLSDPYDQNSAIINIHPGAGGTESQDWAEMLYRMYLRWAEQNGYKTTILDYLAGEEAGIKSVTILVEGSYAFGYLKAEKGVHRLVRISPFDSSGRRHTSFAAVEIMPEVPEDDKTIEVDVKDLKIETFRAGGAGGQHVNTTDSAVRIIHIPTNTIVQCQNERSQIKNRATAMKLLKSKLLELKLKEKEAEMSKIQGEQQDIGWGSQIRSYVFHPYSMVKDHRTNFEKGNVQAVMDGEIDEFITEYLKKMARQ